MSIISIRITDKLLEEIDNRAKAYNIPRTEYIRRAIEYMNEGMLEQELTNRLKEASLRVRKESMRINAEFGAIEHDPEA